MNWEFTVPADAGGERIDQFLTRNITELTRSRLQSLIRGGHVLRNGATPKPSDKVRGDDRITVVEPPLEPANTEAEEIPLSILYEDSELIVINKSAGMVVHPAVGNRAGTLVNALLFHCDELSGVGGVERPGIVHRLDKETSGCMVAAKSDAAHQALTRQFADRTVTKIYLALSSGHFRMKSGTINAPIGRHPIHRQKMTVLERGRTAITSYRVLHEIGADSLVECTLQTGRTHQIRVHLKHLGHPLLGDEVYGKRGAWQRQMLHAWKLSFEHPKTGDKLSFLAPIPGGFSTEYPRAGNLSY